MGSHNELVKVRATFYEPGHVISYASLSDAENDVWFFEDEQAKQIWDALDNPEIKNGNGMFIMHAVHFHYEYPYNGLAGQKTGLGYEVWAGGEDHVFGSETEDFDTILDIACKYFQGFHHRIGEEVVFHLVYSYGSYTNHTEYGKDVSTEWWLYGELDFDRLAYAATPSNLRRKIVCLCGSTRFSEAFQKANYDETLAGNIVLTIGCDMRSDAELFAHLSENEIQRVKWDLDHLHLEKIELADEVLVLNVGGYIGESTRNEIEYAELKNKPIRYLVSIT